MKYFVPLLLLLIPVVIFLVIFCCFSFMLFLFNLGFSEDGKRLMKEHRPFIQMV